MHPKTEKCVSLKDTSFILSGKRCKNQVIELKKTGIYFKTSLPPVAVVVFEGIPHTPLAHPPPPSQNATYLLPEILHKHCFQFSWDGSNPGDQ